MDPLTTLAPHVLTAALIVLAACAAATLTRTFIGPRMSDRIVGVNMIGTQTVCAIVLLVMRLREGWLADVAVVYAMLSFLAVAVLTKIDIGVYRQWRLDQQKSRRRHRENRAAVREADRRYQQRRDDT